MTERMLACFAAAERTGSFSTAAWELSMTQQSVSYSIKKLEDELGFPLFIRRASRVELTAEGEEFHTWYRELDREAARLTSGGLDTVPAGSVTDTQVRCFLAAAEAGDFAAAAETLYYAPQTLSDHVAAFEKAIGLKLFRRENGRAVLTERGLACRDALEKATRSLSEMRDRTRERYKATLNAAELGLSEWLSESGPLLDALNSFDGEVRVRRMSNPDLMAALETGRVDLALWSEGHVPVNHGFEMTALGPEDICLFIPEDGRPAPLLVSPGWPRSYFENRAIITQEVTFGDYAPSGIHLADSLERMKELLRTGQYCFVSEQRFGFLAGEAADPPGLRAVPLPVKASLYACRRSNVGTNCAARLVAHLRSLFGGDTK